MKSFRSTVFLLALALVAACAQMESPPGGPIDDIAPSLIGTMPPDASLETGPLDTLQMRFSEAVDRRSVETSFRSEPARLIRRSSWSGDSLVTFEFWDPFPPDSSICVFLLPGWLDRHGIRQNDWEVLDFSTGSRLFRGWVAGNVDFKRRASENLHLRLEDPEGKWSRSTRPDRQGEFYFRRLPTESDLLLLWAFEDVDGDSLYDPAVDFADSLSDTLLLSQEEPRSLGLTLNVIDPDEPGKLSGSFSTLDSLPGDFIIRLWPDSLRVIGDSIPPGSYPAEWTDSLTNLLSETWDGPQLVRKREGEFIVSGVAPGPWAFFLYRETGTDSLWDSSQEAAWLHPGPLWILPGETISLPNFTFPEEVDSILKTSIPDSSSGYRKAIKR